MTQLAPSRLERSILPSWYQTKAMQIFPASLSMVHMAGLENHLTGEAVTRLREIEDNLCNDVQFAPILRATTEGHLEAALPKAYELAIEYYVEAGIVIWRALGHDYKKLLSLTEASTQLVERIFFDHVKRLDRDVFATAVASLRVLREVGNRIALEEEKTLPEEQVPPLQYLAQVINSTFLLSCLLAYLQGEVKYIRRANLKILSDELFSGAEKVYQEALQRKILRTDAEISFWDPNWQKGEVEADLDKQIGHVKSFDSVKDLLGDLLNE